MTPRSITVDWYGQGKRALEICTATALWYRFGSDPLPIRWVLTREPEGKRPPKALFSTAQTQTAEEIVLDFMRTLVSGNHLRGRARSFRPGNPTPVV